MCHIALYKFILMAEELQELQANLAEYREQLQQVRGIHGKGVYVLHENKSFAHMWTRTECMLAFCSWRNCSLMSRTIETIRVFITTCKRCARFRCSCHWPENLAK